MIAQISQVATKYMSIEHLVNAFEYVNASKTAENCTENSCRNFDGFVGLKLGSLKYVFVVLDLFVLATPEFAWCRFLFFC